jgi:hypothetical protein
MLEDIHLRREGGWLFCELATEDRELVHERQPLEGVLQHVTGGDADEYSDQDVFLIHQPDSIGAKNLL